MTTKEKAAGRAPKAAKRKDHRQPEYTTPVNESQGASSLPDLGTFLETLLIRYRDNIVGMPYHPERSRAVELIDSLVEMTRPGGGGADDDN